MCDTTAYYIRQRDLEKERGDHNQDHYTELDKDMCLQLDAKLEILRPYQLRITKGARKLDFFPRTVKAVWLSNPQFVHLTKKQLKIKNVNRFLVEEFLGQDKPLLEKQPDPPPVKTKQEEYGNCLCGGVYVLRTNKTKQHHFLGCTNFPKCKRTKQIFKNQTLTP